MSDCIFCKIAAKEIPSEKLYEDDNIFVFLDAHPVNPGHALVIPKAHHLNIFDIPEDTFAQVMVGAKKVAGIIKETLQTDGINIGMNNDPAAGQVVFHAHVHVIPRFENDGHKHWHGVPYKEGEQKEIAERIRGAIEKTDQ